ncbi:MAG: hypothetical protein J6B94_08640 [Lachnospiraceae bacterium]|nr:hypothetical protein [Lachnospiraceae bacterium]
MALSVGQIGLDLVVNQKSFNKQMTGITSLAKKTGAALATAFSIKKLVEFGRSCIDLGSDLQEVQNVVDVTFPSMTAQVDKFAQSAATNYGLSETMAKQFSGTFGSMAKAFGFTEKQAYDMGTTLTGLAGDVASFYNITQDEAYTKLKSVFTGETESLKDLGVVMTQTALDSYALANGFGKTTSAMSEAEKVALRYQFVQDQLAAAQGDFARTSDGWANQIRILNLQIDSLKANIGQGLINLFTPILKMINTLLGKLSTLASAFKSFTELITGNKASDGNISSLTSEANSAASGLSSASDAADNLASTTTAVGNAAKKAAKEMKSLMGFDEINKLSKKDEDESSGTSTDASGLNISSATVDYGTLAEDTGNSFLEKLQEKLGNIDLSRLTNSLKAFKEQLSEFGSHLGEGLKWIYENVLVPLAKWVISEVIPRFFETLANVLGILNPVLEALQPLWQWFWENVLKPITSWAAGAFLDAWDTINELLKRFGEWCEEHPGTIRTITTVIASFFAAWKFVEFASKIGEFITSIYNVITCAKNLEDAISLVKFGFEALFGAHYPVVLALGAIVAAGVLLWQNWDTIKEKAKEVWDFVKAKFQEFDDFLTNIFAKDWSEDFGFLGECLNVFLDWVEGRWDAIKNIFSGVIEFVSGVFTGDWEKAWNGARKIFDEFGIDIDGLVSGIEQIFDGLTDFVNGVFSGDWKRAWAGVKTTLKGVWDSMVSVVKNPVNSIIGAINGMIKGVVKGINTVINALNRLKIDIPSWVPVYGGKKFGFNIKTLSTPQIPYLAEGGFVKPNTPQLAMIGDNRHQGEVVAPENKMQNMADEAALKTIAALENYIAAMMAGFEAVVEAIKEKDTDIVIGDEHIGKANERYEEKRAVMTGGT